MDEYQSLSHTKWECKYHCRSQVESSSFEPDRKFRFLGSSGIPMLCWHSRVGVAPGVVAQSRSDGVGSGAIGECPPVTQNP
jgi:hypothetical protein